MSRFTPPAVVINRDRQVIQFRGATGAYLEPPPGRASFDVLKMAREGLMLPLRAAIMAAESQNRTVRRDNVRITRDGSAGVATVQVIPLRDQQGFLIVFEDADQDRVISASETVMEPRPTAANARQSQDRFRGVETDLAELRQYVQYLQEQHEASNEGLQVAQEELQSANEELQSINEELETSKEELESANEELTTVNEEMSNRNAELTRVNGDLLNLQTSTKLVVVLMGRDLTIRRFSQQAERQFDLRSTDLGRPIHVLRHSLVAVARDSADGRSRQAGRLRCCRRLRSIWSVWARTS